MTDRVRVGVVGSGYWGPNFVRSLLEMEDVSLEVVCDVDALALERIKRRASTVGLFTTDISAVFDLGLDALVVATPPETHYNITQRAFEEGLDVLVEKPLTLTIDESVELVNLAQRNDRILMVGHIVEYNPAVKALKELLTSGELGKILYLDGVRAGLGLHRQSLNVLWDLGPHEFSAFMFLLEEFPESVSAQGISCVQEGIEDVVHVTLHFPGGVMAHSRLSWLDPFKARRVNVVGSLKMAVFDDVSTQEKLRIYDKRVDRIQATDTFGEYQFAYHHGSIVSPHIELHEPLAMECRQFIQSVVSREAPPTDGVNGLNVVRILEGAQNSLDSGGVPVPIPSAAGLPVARPALG